jgi:hypothetical protein
MITLTHILTKIWNYSKFAAYLQQKHKYDCKRGKKYLQYQSI